MIEAENTVYLLISILQVVGIGISAWLLLTMVRVLERLSRLEGKFDEFPTQVIFNNRHRIENLERTTDLHTEQITTMRERCRDFHPANH